MRFHILPFKLKYVSSFCPPVTRHLSPVTNIGKYLLLLLPVLSLLFGCKSSRKTSSRSSDKIEVVFDGSTTSRKTAETSAKAGSVSASSSRYPAAEYYGDRWNTEHVRITSDPKPSGTITLDMTTAGANDFVMPFCGKIVSEFGPRNGRMHTGIDIKLDMNDPVYCAFDGMVRMAKNYGNYGKMVVVRHDNGLETLYSHLNTIAVKQNQRVKAGDRIGGGGKTGNAQGEHLHFETRFKGEPFNPRLVVDFEKCCLKTQTLALNDKSYTLYYKNLQPVVKTAQAEKKAPAPQPVKQNIPPPTVAQQAEHVVEKGDTLYNISRRYGTTVEELRKINGLSENSVLKIGQKITVSN